jgi:hypothetical protein
MTNSSIATAVPTTPKESAAVRQPYCSAISAPPANPIEKPMVPPMLQMPSAVPRLFSGKRSPIIESVGG